MLCSTRLGSGPDLQVFPKRIMRRLVAAWLACLLLALVSVSYETIKFNLHSLQITAADYVPASVSAIIDNVYSYALSADGDVKRFCTLHVIA